MSKETEALKIAVDRLSKTLVIAFHDQPGHEILRDWKAILDAVELNVSIRIDAVRYRWLREQDWEKADICCVADPRIAVKLGYDCPSRERLDALVDAGIKKERSK